MAVAAASVVAKKFYMDDFLESFENIEQAVKTSRDLVKLLKLVVFVLTEFVSNIEEITFVMNPEVNLASSPVLRNGSSLLKDT